MKFFVKETAIFTAALIATIGISIGVKSVGYDRSGETVSTPSTPDVQMTRQEKFLSNIMSISSADVDGYINLKTEKFTNAYDIYLKASANLSDLDDVKLNGELNANIDGLLIGGEFGFYDNTVYLSMDERNKFKLGVDSITEFIDKLPTLYGINLNLPEELTNINLDSIQEQIKTMEYVETPAGDKYFILPLLEGLDLHLKTDENYNFKGIRTDSIFFEGMFIKVDINVNYVEETKFPLVNPMESEDASLYQDFRPAFTLFDNLYKVFTKENSGFMLRVDVDKANEDSQMEDYLKSTINLYLNNKDKEYSIVGDLDQSFKSIDRKLPFSFDYINNNIYSALGDNLKVSIQGSTISTLVNYFLNKINDETMDKALDLLSSVLASQEFKDAMEKANSLLGEIEVKENSISVKLNIDVFSDKLSPIVLSINFAEEGNEASFVGLSITGFTFQDFSIDIDLRTIDYQKHVINEAEYVAIDPAVRVLSAVENIIRRDDFRIRMNGAISDASGEKKDITIDGGLQFNLPEEFGYGEVTIIDDNNYRHNIKADMRNKEKILLSYNDTMNIQFNTNTLKDMGELIVGLITNPDDHFLQLFGDLINAFKDGVIGQIIAGDYGAALALRLISNLQISNTAISFDLDLNCIGFDVKMGLGISYEDNINEKGELTSSSLKSVKINNCKVGNTVINLELGLEEFDHSLETSRLDISKEYLDFSDIKVLLELGINTSKYNFYHFNIDFAINLKLLSIIPIDLDISADLKIRVDEQGGVQIAAEFENIPVINLLNKNEAYDSTENGTRKSSLYYDDGTFYTLRSERVTNSTGLFGLAKNEYEFKQVRKFQADFFLDHILEIFLGDVIGVKASTLKSISSSELTESINMDKICYERILKTFTYSEKDNLFYFGISLKALLGMEESNTLFSDLILTVNKKPGESELNSLNVSLSLNLVVLKASINANITLYDDGEITLTDASILSKLNECVATYGELSENDIHTYETFIAYHAPFDL